MKGLSCYIIFFLAVCSSLFSQSGLNQFLKPSDSLNKSRRNSVIIAEATVATATLIGLNQLWYADYSRSSFKTIDDSSEWLQMDKLGHMYSAYQLGSLGANTLNWAGVGKKDQLLYGATLGLGFLTAVEIMDGFSEEWGFSWYDMAANLSGTGLYVGQELLWNEQRVLLKYSFHRTEFAQQRPDKLGNGWSEEFLKDYNGQTYWLSANINSFLNIDGIPKWLNVAFGYGANGMLTGDANEPEFLNQNRIRQYYLSLDVDLTRIETNSNLLRTIFSVFNLIKVPFPTLEFNSDGVLKVHYIYF
ncbi:MAG: YfiM family protein [Winogradskyella sp.]|nr:YfiM family protein [Winogradskyella sp.]